MTAQIGLLQLMPMDMLIFFNKFYLHRNSFTNFICTGIVIFALKPLSSVYLLEISDCLLIIKTCTRMLSLFNCVVRSSILMIMIDFC